jgi:biotin carboxyl carrier protein
MRRVIDLLDGHYQVTVSGGPGSYYVSVENGDPRSAALTVDDFGGGRIRWGDHSAGVQIVVRGETAYIRAFERTFSLRVVDPVEQAAQATGGLSNNARAPMPGLVVDVKVAAGDCVVKGQSMMTIESMKMLTVITAPRDGQVARVHFEPGQTFEKNAVLISLNREKE